MAVEPIRASATGIEPLDLLVAVECPPAQDGMGPTKGEDVPGESNDVVVALPE